MLTIRSFFSNFFSLFFILFHLGCFTFSSRHHDTSSLFKKKRSPPKTTVFSYLKRLFSSSSSSHIPPPPPPSFPSPSSSTRSLRLNPPLIVPLAGPHTNTNTTLHDIAPDIHPCSVCGEIFQAPSSLKHHQSTKHAVSELVDGENIVRIIFKMGWPEKKATTPTIHRILKIHNAPKVVARFEEHRESVKSKAAAAAKIKNILIRDERCAADGNELLRFYCTTFICGLDSTICSHQFCSACGIIRYGFSQKLDGIPTLPTSWKAHAAVPDDIEEEFSFMHVKRALLVCRVIAGRVGSDPGLADGSDHGFDSLVGPGGGGFGDELLVFNPRAVLPCFVIVYTVV